MHEVTQEEKWLETDINFSQRTPESMVLNPSLFTYKVNLTLRLNGTLKQPNF